MHPGHHRHTSRVSVYSQYLPSPATGGKRGSIAPSNSWLATMPCHAPTLVPPPPVSKTTQQWKLESTRSHHRRCDPVAHIVREATRRFALEPSFVTKPLSPRTAQNDLTDVGFIDPLVNINQMCKKNAPQPTYELIFKESGKCASMSAPYAVNIIHNSLSFLSQKILRNNKVCMCKWNCC